MNEAQKIAWNRYLVRTEQNFQANAQSRLAVSAAQAGLGADILTSLDRRPSKGDKGLQKSMEILPVYNV